jgi:hypothetical protein
MNMNNEYITRDFYAAGYLVAKGHKLVSHSKSGGITTFIFNKDENLEGDTYKYYAMQAYVEPISYGNALKSLKSVIHSYDQSANTNTKNYVPQNRNKE